MIEADGLIWGSPVWTHTSAPWLMHLISRARYMAFLSGELRDKVLGTYVVSWFGVGEEMALMTLEAWDTIILCFRCIAAGQESARSLSVSRPEYLEHGALDDTSGMHRIRTMAKRVVEISRKIKVR